MQTKRILLEHCLGSYIVSISNRSFANRDRLSLGCALVGSASQLSRSQVMNRHQTFARHRPRYGRDGIAWEGPDSDALKGDLRERNGEGVHFSAKGLRVHGERWSEKVLALIDRPNASLITVRSDFEGGNVEVVQLIKHRRDCASCPRCAQDVAGHAGGRCEWTV